MFESWSEVVWHIAYLLIFAASMAMARTGKGYTMEKQDSDLDSRRQKGGYTFNTILKEMRADFDQRESEVLEDIVSSQNPEAREMAVMELKFLKTQRERIDRLLNMKDPE